MRIILASKSPRRRELLGKMGLEFSVQAADIDETMNPSLPPKQEVARVSRAKAAAIPADMDTVVIAADTIVVCQGKILGKPHNQEEARQMLRQLAGKTHQVMTGCAVRRGDALLHHTEITDVAFRPLADAEIEAYVKTGEPMDKAGAYGIQGLGGLFVQRLSGDYYNVMGLPICALTQMLRQVGVRILGVANEEEIF